MRRLLSLALLALVGLPTAARSQSSTGLLPERSLAADGEALVATLNGPPAARERFLRERLGAVPLSERPLDAWAAFLDLVAVQSGGVDAVETRPRPGRLDVVLRAREGDRVARAILFGPDESGRLEGLYVVPMIEWAPPDAWPADGPATDAEWVAEVDRQARATAARDAFSGVLLLSAGDSVLYRGAFGEAEKAFGVPNAPGTRFGLASIGKLFTTVAVLQLVEGGRLRLDDAVADLLPAYPNEGAARRITVAHLLTHSAGLGNLFERAGFDPYRIYESHAELVDVFGREPLVFEPGSEERYSNEGFLVLGAVVERLSGLPYAEYVRRHVFGPAGMTDSGFEPLGEVVPFRAVGYRLREGDPFGAEPRQPTWYPLGGVGSHAAGGGYATADDLFRFARALREGRLLGPDALTLLAEPHAVGAVRRGLGVQLGEADGIPVLGHGGGGPASGVDTELRWTADGAYTVVVLANYEMVASPLAYGALGYAARRLQADTD